MGRSPVVEYKKLNFQPLCLTFGKNSRILLLISGYCSYVSALTTQYLIIMNTLYQTTAPRLSMKDNEVVINAYTNRPDVQIAGLITKVGETVFQSDKIDSITGLPSKPFYRGKATIWRDNENKDVDIIIPASQITAVSVGDTKWLTARPNGEYTGYSCGGLDVTNPDSVDVFEQMLKDLGYSETVETPAVETEA